MDRPPRDMKNERLVDRRLIIYSYAIIGVLETLVCLLAFFTVFSYYGIPGSVVYNSSPPYFQGGAPDLVVGTRVFTAGQQIAILYEAHSAYYLTLVLSQASRGGGGRVLARGGTRVSAGVRLPRWLRGTCLSSRSPRPLAVLPRHLLQNEVHLTR